MNNLRYRLLVGTGIIIAMVISGLGTPSYADEGSSDTQLGQNEGSLYIPLTNAHERFASELKPFKRFKFFKNFKKKQTVLNFPTATNPPISPWFPQHLVGSGALQKLSSGP